MAEKKIASKYKDKYNDKGQEIMDPTPMSIPVNFKRPEPLGDMIRRLVRKQISEAAVAKGMESFDDADDFNIPDDPVDPLSPYEDEFEGDNKPAINEPKVNLIKLKKKAAAAIQAVKDGAAKIAEAEMAKKNNTPVAPLVQTVGQPPASSSNTAPGEPG